MKQFLLILLLSLTIGITFGQTDTLNKSIQTAVNRNQIEEPTKTSIPVKRDTQLNSISIPILDLNDSVKIDTLRKDTVPTILVSKTFMQIPDTLNYQKYYVSPWLPFQKTPVFEIESERKFSGKDELFYILTALVLVLASIRLIFPKYFKNLFLLFMQTSIRQKQTREQLLQNNLASIFLNILFVASAGIYITLLIRYKQWADIPFFELLVYCVGILFIIYLGKYLFLAFSGWVFNVPDATNAYSFTVFLVNKVLGIVLIPFILMVTFSPMPMKQVAITISAGVASLLFIYRYLISFGVIRTNLKVSALHFFLYLCAVELLPLLLIYKLLVNFVAGSI